MRRKVAKIILKEEDEEMFKKNVRTRNCRKEKMKERIEKYRIKR